MQTRTPWTTRGARTAAAVAVGAGLALTAPVAASAEGGRSGDRADQRSGVPSRVSTKLARVSRGLDRAEGYVEDGESAKAASALAGVRRNLASAQRTTLRYVAADNARAAGAAGAVERAEHAVVVGAAGLYDGQSGDTVTAVSSTLDAALDGRDALLVGVGAQDVDDYGRYYAKVVRDTAPEVEDLGDTASDDELTAEATAALTDAAARAAAQGETAEAAAGTSSDDEDEGRADAGSTDAQAVASDGRQGGRGDCGPDGSGQQEDGGTSTSTTAAAV